MLNADELRKISKESKISNFVEEHFGNAEDMARLGKNFMTVNILDAKITRQFIDSVVDYLEKLNFVVDVSDKLKTPEPLNVNYPESPRHIGYTIRITW